MLHVVAGIIINDQQQLLVAQRPQGKSFEGYWEFPGGKIEVGESNFAALQRELAEELGIEVISAKLFHQTTYHYSDKTVVLDFWQVQEFSGIAAGAEGQLIKWVKPKELLQQQFMPANQEIIQKLL